MSDKQAVTSEPMDGASTDSERREAAAVPGACPQQKQPPTIIPLLSEVVVPGAALTEAVNPAAAERRPKPAVEGLPVEEQLVDRLPRKVAALVEATVRQALTDAVDPIVRNILSQLHQQLAIRPDELTSTPTPPPPDPSLLTSQGEKPL